MRKRCVLILTWVGAAKIDPMTLHPQSPTVSESFFRPILDLLSQCQNRRVCPEFSDECWFKFCLGRVLHEAKSGRGFLQEFGSLFPQCPAVSAFFESLKSSRRAGLVGELNTRMRSLLTRVRPDPLAEYRALEGFEIYAGDGHWHGAAAHDAAVEGTKYAMGHFFGLNLRTHAAVHLTGADQEARRKEHDMRALKRLGVEILRQGAAAGRKVIWVWDKAGIDFRQWHQWKQGSGIYMISCAKENMKLEGVGSPRWNREDPVNAGVLADEWVSTSVGVFVRRVRYRDPVSGTIFEFLTNETTLAPGWIAHLYRMRWDIEKVFDAFKNKLGEKKAWASGAVAKTIQANLLCLAHNLLLLFEDRVLKPAGVTNVAEDKRRAGRLEKTKEVLAERQETLPMLVEKLQRCTQSSVKFIRWLRSNLFSQSSCSQSLAPLRALYAKL